MTFIILAIIYFAFISLGLPDSILGVAIPALQQDWGISLGQGGLVSMVVIGGTIVSSFFSAPVIRRLGTGRVTFISCLMTGAALLGISFVPSWPWLILLAIPLGLGGGTVDTALNNYVALNYKAHHMNWLHSFWGVGATAGPLVMAWALSARGSWRYGYRGVSVVQLVLAVILLASLPLWRRREGQPGAGVSEDGPAPPAGALRRIPGIAPALLTMLFYCAAEAGVGLLGGSFLVRSRGLAVEAASRWMSMYFAGITAGRFLSGMVSMKLDNTSMIRYGALVAFTGGVLLLLPAPPVVMGPAFVLIGLGFAPVFPAMLHETPVRFGKENSQKIIGYQMGFGYIGSAVLPPLVAAILEKTGTAPFPWIILSFIVLMFAASERVAARTAAHR